jgi:hypothetical protein
MLCGYIMMQSCHMSPTTYCIANGMLSAIHCYVLKKFSIICESVIYVFSVYLKKNTQR